MSVYRKIINDITEFFETHNQVYTVQFGNSTDISTKNTKFPFVFIESTDSQLYKHEIIYNFNIYSFTLYEQDKSNILSSLDDTQLILTDFVSYFNNLNDDEYDILVDATIQPFTAKFDDYTNGWILNCKFSTAYYSDSCDIPNN